MKSKKKENGYEELGAGQDRNRDVDLLENGLEDTGRGKGKLG